MASSPLQTCGVIVAGAGPVGLVAALALARAGLSVQVLEASEALTQDLRASTFHPPTLDMLDAWGITAQLLVQGLVCPHWQVRLHPSGEHAKFDLSVLAQDTHHPYRLQCEQYKLSAILLEALRAYPNAQVFFSHAVEGFHQTADDVHVSIQAPATKQPLQLTCRFLIGADGARSMVRKTLGVDFEGSTYPETTILATTRFPFEDHLPDLSPVSYCWLEGGRNFSLLKVPGRWRVSVYPDEGVDTQDEAQMREAVQRTLQQIAPQASAYEILELRAYRVHQRLAAKYGEGRVWLAGDAAHLNSPAGGMGLNGGIHDALALASAIEAVHKGEPLARLQRYERQRRPVAEQQIIAQADANRSRMRETDAAARRAALEKLQAICADRQALHAHLLRSSMIEGLRSAADVM